MKGFTLMGLLLLVLFGLVTESNAYRRRRRSYSKKSYSKKNYYKKKTPSPSMQPTEDTPDCVFEGGYLDRDDPSGTGDYERIVDFGENNICNGDTPLDISCVSVNGEIDFDDYPFGAPLQYEQLYCEADKGFLCKFSEGFSCPDFKVKFCCPNGDSSDDDNSSSKKKKSSKNKRDSSSKGKGVSSSSSSSSSDNGKSKSKGGWWSGGSSSSSDGKKGYSKKSYSKKSYSKKSYSKKSYSKKGYSKKY